MKQFKTWEQKTMFLAAIYNVIWGGLVIALPHKFFDWAGMERINYPEIWQCVGMIVGVYGVGYFISAYDPYRHWPIILVGFMGKVFGPIGFLQAIITDRFPIEFGVNIIFNDLIWWIPFFLILRNKYKQRGEA